MIRSNPHLRAVIENEDLASVRTTLEACFPDAYATIDCWSMRYKLTLEDIDVLSDTDEYLGEIRKRLQNGSSMSPELLSSVFQNFRHTHGTRDDILNVAKHTDPDLYLLFRGLGQHRGGRKWHSLGSRERRGDQPPLAGSPGPAGCGWRLRSGLAASGGERPREYPEIKRVLRISKMQFPLREDAHHLIVPLQRTIGKMMIAAAAPFAPSVLPQPEHVFDLCLEELVALLKEMEPGYVSLSRDRWQILLAAERNLQRTWTIEKDDLRGITADPEGMWSDLTYENKGHGYIDSRGFIQDKFRALKDSRAMELSPEHEPCRQAVFDLLHRRFDAFGIEFAAFEQATSEAVKILDLQIAAATIERVKSYYRDEQARLAQRITDFRAKMENEN